jgi:mRNA-degrading endonuclease toxin of MazEF toxin-antitoxin module
MDGIASKMRFTMTYKPWDIVLVPFTVYRLPQTKKGPALLLSPREYNQGCDLIIMFRNGI